MSSVSLPTVFYAFEPRTSGGGPGLFLAYAGTMMDLNANPRVPENAQILSGPYYGTSSRGEQARINYEPWRMALGKPETVENRKPWLLFVRGEAMASFATQAEALGHLLAVHGLAVPAMVDENGKLF